MESTGTLSIVATPIGNMEDITLRAIRVLGEADYILCEDTRETGKLLKHHGIEATMKRYDAHASEKTHSYIIDDIQNGKRVALVSDAGTPGVSDPGVRLVALVRQSLGEGVCIEAIPGPSAVTAAFSIAGIAGNQFSFLGYVPQKKGRQTFFSDIASYDHPVMFFESTHRITKTLESLAEAYPERRIYVGRELTKMYEEMLVGTAAEILAILNETPKKQKGEFVVIVGTV